MGTRKRWSQDDDSILFANYGKIPLQKIQEMLSSQRTAKSIEMHAWSIGIMSGSPRENCQEKLLEVLKEVKECSRDEMSKRAKIPEGSVSSAMHLLRAKGLVHIGRILKAKKRGKTTTFYLYRFGPGQDATEVEELRNTEPEFSIPRRDEITAALFGIAPEVNFSPVPSRIYQQA